MLDAVSFAASSRAATPKKLAREAGLKRYFTGKPCRNGHVCERFVSCGSCVDCQIATSARLKSWSRAYHLKWGAANREKQRAYSAKWRDKNPGAVAAYMAARRDANREAINARARARYALDPQRHLAKSRAYLRANKERVAAYARKRRARKAAADGSHTPAEIAFLAKKQRFKCAYCRASIRRGYHADHITPLALGGSNWIRNIQLLCPTCNTRKGAKDPLQFAEQQGLLL